MADKYDELFNRIQNRLPNLLLGSGFSLDAVNKEDKPLPSGEALSNYLYKHFFASHLIDLSGDSDIEKYIESQKDYLLQVCDRIEDYGKTKDRDKELTRIFSGAHSSKTWYELLPRFPWKYIFTLNIDDLVENIYETQKLELKVWDKLGQVQLTPDATTLVKLHGNVRFPDKGYVFNSREYDSFSNTQSGSLRVFAEEFITRDLILIGTQYDENDLNIITNLYEKLFTTSNKNQFYFISPNLKPELKIKVNNKDNWHWIENSTAKEFLEELSKRVSIQNDSKNQLIENGAFFLSDIQNDAGSIRKAKYAPHSYEIYKGRSFQFRDFLNEEDIRYPDTTSWMDTIAKDKQISVVSIIGNDYVGKTCRAMRLMVDLYHHGYITLKLNRVNDDICRLIIDYFKSLPEFTNIVIYNDDAYNFLFLRNIIDKATPNIQKLVLITDELRDNHQGKRYIFKDLDCFHEFDVAPIMDRSIALEIYYKLHAANRLGHYLDLLHSGIKPGYNKSKKIITKKITESEDIIDALFYASEGSSFKEHYVRWVEDKKNRDDFNVVVALCGLTQFGIEKIPLLLASEIGREYYPKFKLSEFAKAYSDVIISRDGHLKLIRNRMLEAALGAIDHDIYLRLIKVTALQCRPDNEQINNEEEHIFEKILKVKRIKRKGLLISDEIVDVFGELEKQLQDLSYFWVQYGIAAQEVKKFEDADNHLLYAKHLRDDSYKVKHAYAKNQMEWGIDLILRGLDGEDKFKQGAELLDKIISNDKYIDSIDYSVHTYVNMWLRYNKLTGKDIESTAIYNCQDYLKYAIGNSLGHPDQMIAVCAKQFADYCFTNGMKNISSDIRNMIKDCRYPGKYNEDVVEEYV